MPIRQSQQFNEQHRLEAGEPIQYGYRDGGRRMQFDANGAPLNRPTREIIVVRSPAQDPELRRAIDQARAAMADIPTVEGRARFLNRFVTQLMPQNDPALNEQLMDRLAGGAPDSHVGREISLGELIQARTGVCRHRSLLFKVLADATGIPTALVRGNFYSNDGGGGHAWNEVVREDGSRILVDVMHDFVGDTRSDYARNYHQVDDQRMYPEAYGQTPRQRPPVADLTPPVETPRVNPTPANGDAEIGRVTDFLRSELGERNILNVQRVRGGYRVEVPATYSRSNFIDMGIPADAITREGGNRPTHFVTIADHAMPALGAANLEGLLAGRAVERIHTNRGYTIMIRGNAAELGTLQDAFRQRGIDVVMEARGGQFGEGLRVRSTGVEQTERLLRANSLENMLAGRREAGAIERLSTNRGYTMMIRGNAAELEPLQREFRNRGIDVVMEPRGSEFGEGLRVRSTGVEQAERLLGSIEPPTRSYGSARQPLPPQAVQPQEVVRPQLQQQHYTAEGRDSDGRVTGEAAARARLQAMAQRAAQRRMANAPEATRGTLPYTPETILHDGREHTVLDTARMHPSDFETVLGRKTATTQVRIAVPGEVIVTSPGSVEESRYVATGGEVIFANSPQDTFVPRDGEGRPNGHLMLAERYEVVSGSIEQGGVFRPRGAPSQLLHEAVDRPTVILDAWGPGQHQFLDTGATLKFDGDRVTGIDRIAFNSTWSFTDADGAITQRNTGVNSAENTSPFAGPVSESAELVFGTNEVPRAIVVETADAERAIRAVQESTTATRYGRPVPIVTTTMDVNGRSVTFLRSGDPAFYFGIGESVVLRDAGINAAFADVRDGQSPRMVAEQSLTVMDEYRARTSSSVYAGPVTEDTQLRFGRNEVPRAIVVETANADRAIRAVQESTTATRYGRAVPIVTTTMNVNGRSVTFLRSGDPAFYFGIGESVVLRDAGINAAFADVRDGQSPRMVAEQALVVMDQYRGSNPAPADPLSQAIRSNTLAGEVTHVDGLSFERVRTGYAIGVAPGDVERAVRLIQRSTQQLSGYGRPVPIEVATVRTPNGEIAYLRPTDPNFRFGSGESGVLDQAGIRSVGQIFFRQDEASVSSRVAEDVARLGNNGSGTDPVFRGALANADGAIVQNVSGDIAAVPDTVLAPSIDTASYVPETPAGARPIAVNTDGAAIQRALADYPEHMMIQVSGVRELTLPQPRHQAMMTEILGVARNIGFSDVNVVFHEGPISAVFYDAENDILVVPERMETLLQEHGDEFRGIVAHEFDHRVRRAEILREQGGRNAFDLMDEGPEGRNMRFYAQDFERTADLRAARMYGADSIRNIQMRMMADGESMLASGQHRMLFPGSAGEDGTVTPGRVRQDVESIFSRGVPDVDLPEGDLQTMRARINDLNTMLVQDRLGILGGADRPGTVGNGNPAEAVLRPGMMQAGTIEALLAATPGEELGIQRELTADTGRPVAVPAGVNVEQTTERTLRDFAQFDGLGPSHQTDALVMFYGREDIGNLLQRMQLDVPEGQLRGIHFNRSGSNTGITLEFFSPQNEQAFTAAGGRERMQAAMQRLIAEGGVMRSTAPVPDGQPDLSRPLNVEGTGSYLTGSQDRLHRLFESPLPGARREVDRLLAAELARPVPLDPVDARFGHLPGLDADGRPVYGPTALSPELRQQLAAGLDSDEIPGERGRLAVSDIRGDVRLNQFLGSDAFVGTRLGRPSTLTVPLPNVGDMPPGSLLVDSPLARAPGTINVNLGRDAGLGGPHFNITGSLIAGTGNNGIHVGTRPVQGRAATVGHTVGPFSGLALGGLGIHARHTEGGSLDRAEQVEQGLAEAGFARPTRMGTGERVGVVADFAVIAPDVPLAANALAQVRGGPGFLSRGAAGALGRGSLLLAAGWTAIEMDNARQAQDGQREAGALYGLLGGVAGGAAGGAVTGGPWGMLIGAVGGGFISSEYGRRSSLGDQMQRNLDRRAQLAVDGSIARIQQMNRTLVDGGQLSERDRSDLRGIVPGLIEQYHRLRVLPLAETDFDGALRRDFQMRQITQALQFIDPRTPEAQRQNLVPYTAGQMNTRVEGQLAGVLAQINANPQLREQLEIEWYTPANDGSLRAADPRVPLTPMARQRRRFGHEGPTTTADLIRLVRSTPGLDLYMLDRDGNGLTANELMDGLRGAGAIGHTRDERYTLADAVGNGVNGFLAPEISDVSPERRREYYTQLRRLVPDPRAPGASRSVEVRQGYEALLPFVQNEQRLSMSNQPRTPEDDQMQELIATSYFENYHGGDMASGLSTAQRAINRNRPLYPTIESLDRAGIGALLTGENALRNVHGGAFRLNSEDFAHNIRVVDNLLIADGIDDSGKEAALDVDGDGVLSVEEYMAGLTPEHQAAMRAHAPVRQQQIAQAEEAERAALEARQAEDARLATERARGAELYAEGRGGVVVTATQSDSQRARRARDLVDTIRGQLSPELLVAMDKDAAGQTGHGSVQQGEFSDFAREAGVRVDLNDRDIRRHGLTSEVLAQLDQHRQRLGRDIGTAATAQLSTEMVAAIDSNNSQTIDIGELGRFMRANNIVDANGQELTFAQLEAELQRNNGQLPTVILEQIRLNVTNGGDTGGQSR